MILGERKTMQFLMRLEDGNNEPTFIPSNSLDDLVDMIVKREIVADRKFVIDNLKNFGSYFGLNVYTLLSHTDVDRMIEELDYVKPSLYSDELSKALEAWVPR